MPKNTELTFFQRARRGQAMTEYSVVTFILSLGALGLLAVPIPTGVTGTGTRLADRVHDRIRAN